MSGRTVDLSDVEVVDNHVHAGAFLKGPDVTTFPANDSPFHVIARNINGADRRICGVLCRITLDRHP